MIYFILVIIFILIIKLKYLKRKKEILKKISTLNDLEKLTIINKILIPFVFEFDLDSDIIISTNNSWQRKFGYTDLYDLNASFFNIVIDIEPIYFEYENKLYRLELWKGQYGIATGAEIGLYIQEENTSFFRAAKDDEKLSMAFILYKEDYFLFSRNNSTWWLTGFKLGTFSKKKDLNLKACIIFPNKEMQYSFIKGLL